MGQIERQLAETRRELCEAKKKVRELEGKLQTARVAIADLIWPHETSLEHDDAIERALEAFDRAIKGEE